MKYLFTFLTSLSLLTYADAPVNTDNITTPSATPSANAPNPKLNLNVDMSASEQQIMGINKLTSAQKTALANWISTWAQSQNASANNKTASVAPNAVSAIIASGHYVKLGDGSSWNISPNCWIYTYYWNTGDTVEIGKSLDTLFPYTITNTKIGQTVNGQKAADTVASSLKNSFTIDQVSDAGQFIRLSNGSLWQVNLSSRYLAASWTQGQQVFVIKRSQAVEGGYEILNGDNSRSIYANLVKKEASQKNNSLNKSNSSNNNSSLNNSTNNASQNTSQTNPS